VQQGVAESREEAKATASQGGLQLRNINNVIYIIDFINLLRYIY
jgi:hypothetical protein